jgi:hypothetical protein
MFYTNIRSLSNPQVTIPSKGVSSDWRDRP